MPAMPTGHVDMLSLDDIMDVLYLAVTEPPLSDIGSEACAVLSEWARYGRTWPSVGMVFRTYGRNGGGGMRTAHAIMGAMLDAEWSASDNG